MTPKYSAEWWEKVAAQTLEAVFRQRATAENSSKELSGRGRETALAEPEHEASLADSR